MMNFVYHPILQEIRSPHISFSMIKLREIVVLNIKMLYFHYAVSKMQTMIKLYGIHYLPTAIYIKLKVGV